LTNKKKRVFILAFPIDNQSAGIHTYTKELLSSILSIENSIFEYVLVKHQYMPEYKQQKQIIIPRLKWLPGWSSFMLFVLIPILSLIHKANIIVEPAHFGPFNLPRHIKRVTVIHDLTPIIFPALHTFNGSFLQKLFLPSILKNASLVISNSLNTKSDIENHYPVTKGKIENIYLGISDLMINTQDPNLEVKYKISGPYILFIGTIEPRKNLGLLLGAFQILSENHQINHQLVIAGGKGWKNETLFNKINNHPQKTKIKLPGFIDNSDLAALYSMADVFVYPSLYEGFGLPPAEAMACGTKCVIPYNSSLKEVGDGIAYFYSEDKAEVLAGTILDAIEDTKYKSKSSEIKSRFNWNNYGAQFEKALQTI